jgi:hypothetical protein
MTVLKRIAPTFAGALLLLITLAAPLYLAGNFQVRAAPSQVPLRGLPGVAGPVQVVNLNTASIITTTTFAGGRWSALGSDTPATQAEIFLFVDETTVNTTTFVLQVSPDGTTWVNHSTGSALATDVAADSNTYKVAAIEGVFYQIVATASNSNTLTPTIKVVLR